MKKLRILCMCGENTLRSVMAEGFLKKLGGPQVAVQSAGVKKGKFRPEVAKVLGEVDIDASQHVPKSLADLKKAHFDVVITMCDEAREQCTKTSTEGKFDQNPVFVGDPVHIHWSIPHPDLEGDRDQVLSRLRNTRAQVEDRVKSFLEHGYLTALRRERWHLSQVMDAMEDGVILHDKNRHIYLFNQAAERITGYRREEVEGSDCHQVFQPDGLCGSQCPMDKWSDSFKGKQYEVAFTTRDGVDKRLRMTSAPIEMEEGGEKGVIATFRDITEYSELRFKMKEKYSFHGMVGMSPAMQDVFLTIRQVTTADYPVLISGESGTGKELVARALHEAGDNAEGPFVTVNCGAIPEGLLESELFGHKKGAFTGAVQDKAGLFKVADGGTIFLDEVGETPLQTQVKLLRVLQEREIVPVGDTRPIAVDVRVIAATNTSLEERVGTGTFREDLFYRLNVVPIHIPPLRERREDIPLLARHFIMVFGRGEYTFSDSALTALTAYTWPGNVRELENAVENAVIMTDSPVIDTVDLPVKITEPPDERMGALPESDQAPTLETIEKAYIAWVLKQTGGIKTAAAEILGIDPSTLHRKMDRYGMRGEGGE